VLENAAISLADLNEIFAAPNPVRSLVFSWWMAHTPPPRLSEGLFREALVAAATAEIRIKSPAGRGANRTSDHRFKWACQLLDVAQGERLAVDGALESLAAFLFKPLRPLWGRSLASGEREPSLLLL
jgi:hypothetical protein